MLCAISTSGLAQLFVTLLLARLAHVTAGFGTPPLVGLDSSPATHLNRKSAVRRWAGLRDGKRIDNAFLQQVVMISVLLSYRLQDYNHRAMLRVGGKFDPVADRRQGLSA